MKGGLGLGRPALNGWSMVPSPVAVEAYAKLGWDSVTLDLQHGWWDYSTAVVALAVLQGLRITSLVRVPTNEPGVIGRMLDAGAAGIICPMVNTVEGARRLVQAGAYPPIGERSCGPIRGMPFPPPPDFHAEGGQRVLLLPQIETIRSVEEVEGILNVPGIEGIYVGPGDLGQSMGLPATLDREEPELLGIYEKLATAAARRGLVAGIHNHGADYARRMIDLGYGLVTVGSDLGHMLTGGLSETRQFDGLVLNHRPSPY